MTTNEQFVGGLAAGCAVVLAFACQHAPAPQPSAVATPRPASGLTRQVPDDFPRPSAAPASSPALEALRKTGPVRMSSVRFSDVVELEGGFELDPVGQAAFLKDRQGMTHSLLLLEGNVITYRAELEHFSHVNDLRWMTAIDGSWPNDAWMAYVSASDTGPSCTTIYKWAPGPVRSGAWDAVAEIPSGVLAVRRWQDGVVTIGRPLAVPVHIPLEVNLVTPGKVTALQSSACSSTNQLPLPLTVTNREVVVSGFRCGDQGPFALADDAVLIQRWSDVASSESQTLVDDDEYAHSRMFWDDDQLLVVSDGKPRLLLRAVGPALEPIGELPSEFVTASAPDSATLWGRLGSYLVVREHGGWLAFSLPEGALSAAPTAAWDYQVWQRGNADVWLFALESRKTKVLHTGAIEVSATLPSSAELLARAMLRRELPAGCREVVVELLELNPFLPDGVKDSDLLTRARGLQLVRQAAASVPSARAMAFDCCGRQCLAVVVGNQAEVQSVRASVQVPVLNRSSRTYCGLPPGSTAVAR